MKMKQSPAPITGIGSSAYPTSPASGYTGCVRASVSAAVCKGGDQHTCIVWKDVKVDGGVSCGRLISDLIVAAECSAKLSV